MLKLIQTQYGQFDLALINSLEDQAVAVTKTVVYGVLFTDTRAPDGRVPDPYDQRGWWQNPQAGSGLWYVRRQARSESAKRETVQLAQRALEAYEGMRDIVVTDLTESGNVSSVEIDIRGYYYETPFSVVLTDELFPVLESAMPAPDTEVWTEPWTEPWIN